MNIYPRECEPQDWRQVPGPCSRKGGSPVDSPKFRIMQMPRLASPRQLTLAGRAIIALEPPRTRRRGGSVLNYPSLFWSSCQRNSSFGPRMLKPTELRLGFLPCGHSTAQHHNIADTSEQRTDVYAMGHGGVKNPWDRDARYDIIEKRHSDLGL
ncbi:hypothetical protein CORC01_10398 [Colletotrichum orchidophilum]|uniref:Uncharacterized protein n=1 Tax=Colletotrichum orchidophilum TaxID=1209926 RepID=A0A1G4AYZ9_9PEZI|nr:uncharacterized protein CORC01_10398 [Colletotrichum orchidophilum]OHE94351.1 hypothetical protein CORC01_10398 [Colletotrichum orchidophilum]